MVDVIDAGVALQERQILMVPGYTETSGGDGAYYVTRYLGALPDRRSFNPSVQCQCIQSGLGMTLSQPAGHSPRELNSLLPPTNVII